MSINMRFRSLLHLLAASAVLAFTLIGNTYAVLPVYQRVPSWGPVPSSPGLEWEMSGIAVNMNGTRVFAARRADPPMLELDAASGRIVRSWGQGLLAWPHSVYADRFGFIWVADATVGSGSQPSLALPIRSAVLAKRGHQVLKFSREGKLLMALGTQGVAGDGPNQLQAPTGVAVAAGGEIFVSEGHSGTSNARVVKFTKDGKFIKAWGRKGKGPGEFGEPHAIALDSRGRVLVADRSNGRIEVFTPDGAFVEEWKAYGPRPSGIAVMSGDVLVVTSHDNRTNTITIGSAWTGEVSQVIHDVIEGVDGVAVDLKGDIYVTAATSRSVGKWSTHP